jgi:hypothetical protein
VFARVARFEGVNVEAAERTMEAAEAIVRPLVEALDGYAGHLEVLSSGGEFISITLFDSEQDAERAEPTFDEEMPRKLGDLFSDWEGRRLAVGRFNVLADGRR